METLGVIAKSLQIRHLCSSIFRHRSGYYLLYQRIEMCKSHENVHNSFLDSQIKRTKHFNFNPPSYQEITQIIKHVKSSGSPCPLDQISIICFKRCPYLRSFILNICTEVLRSNNLPAQWTKVATILIHKKGDSSLPENFRSIILEPVKFENIYVIASKQSFCIFN